MKSIIHIVTNLLKNEGFTLSNKGKFAWTKYLGTLLKLRANENRTNENRTNQGPGVLWICEPIIKSRLGFWIPTNSVIEEKIHRQLNILDSLWLGTPDAWFMQFSLVRFFLFVHNFKRVPKYLVHADFSFLFQTKSFIWA